MNILLFDTETTGLIKPRVTPLNKQPEIIEFYGLRIDEKGDKIDELELLIKPEGPITAEITGITGITKEMVANSPQFYDVAGKIREFIQTSDEIVAHNLKFDMGMLDLEYRRMGEILKYPEKKTCTVEKNMWIKGRRLKLIELHFLLFNEPFESAHRARNDVMALARCFIDLRNKGKL